MRGCVVSVYTPLFCCVCEPHHRSAVEQIRYTFLVQGLLVFFLFLFLLPSFLVGCSRCPQMGGFFFSLLPYYVGGWVGERLQYCGKRQPKFSVSEKWVSSLTTLMYGFNVD